MLSPAQKRAHAKWAANNPDRMTRYWQDGYRRNIVSVLLSSARARARKRGLDFNLTPEDIVIPEVCPALGIPIFVAEPGSKRGGKPNSPSLDRIDNAKGYVKGNVQVISWRANALKKDATADELRRVADFMEASLAENS